MYGLVIVLVIGRSSRKDGSNERTDNMGTINYKSRKGRPIKYGAFEASMGNNKLPRTTCIYNMTTALDCPSDKLGLCNACRADKNYCYARKTERLFKKTCYAYRTRQAEYWANCTAEEFVSDLLKAVGKRPIKLLRFNESGDFRSYNDVLKAEKIAELLSEHGIKVYCYTSRRDLDYGTRPGFLRIMGSGFLSDGINGCFDILEPGKEVPEGYGTCPGLCDDCVRCVIGLNTVVPLH